MTQRPYYHYVLYKGPDDHPDAYVLRRFLINRETGEPEPDAEPTCVGTEAECVAHVPFSHVSVGRSYLDAPSIVRTYI